MKQLRVRATFLITLPNGIDFPSDAEIQDEIKRCLENKEEVESIHIEKIEGE